MKVVIAGGGIAGNVLLRQLRKRSDITSLRAYERRSYQDASPPGLNVLMNHNGLAITQEMDPELYQVFQDLGSEVCNWSARDMSGDILYHLQNVVSTGEAPVAALVARWDLIHAATRCDELTDYNVEAIKVEEEEHGTLKVLMRRHLEQGDTQDEWITGIDLLIAADGRYSTLRQQLAPTASYYGPPYVLDFRIVAKGVDTSLLTEEEPVWRVYNKPNPALFVDEPNPAIQAAASAGCVRVGMMKLEDGTLGLFGNIAMPNEHLDDAIKSSEVLVKLFHHNAPDAFGKLLLTTLQNHGDSAHWARKQETDTCYEALGGKVLFIGDASGAIYPSLGQGANLSLEDAAVAAACFPHVHQISQLRHSRREFIKTMSRQHAEHVYDPLVWDLEITNWADPESEWRSKLRRLWCGKQLALRAVTATTETIAPYGQLIGESLDGDIYSPMADAVLDLSHGTPRLYLMKLTGGRPLQVSQITKHGSVTQCLGALGTDEDFYLVVHAPCEKPTLEGLQAIRIPPRHFIKLHAGTWHAGPLWQGEDLDRTFYNLELADTNVVDHTTIQFSDMLPGSSEGEKILIPIMPVLS